MSRIGKTNGLFLAAAITIGLLSASFVLAEKGGRAEGGKGGGKPGDNTLLPGVIYFEKCFNCGTPDFFTHLYRMNTLGIESTPLALPDNFGGAQSNNVYGSDEHHWYLYFRDVRTDVITNPDGSESTRTWHELFASPNGVDEIQVTDFTTDENFIILTHDTSTIAWSTGDDLFFSFPARDRVENKGGLYRIRVGADDLEAAFNGKPSPISFPVAANDPDLVELIWDSPRSMDFRRHHWSPTGDRLVFVMNDTDDERDEDLWLLDLTNADGPVHLWTDSSSSAHPRWSPDGSMLVFADLGDLILMNPDQPNDWSILVSGWFNANSEPAWSLDGSHIAFVQLDVTNRRGFIYRIFRVPVTGGKPMDISKELDKFVPKRLIGWKFE